MTLIKMLETRKGTEDGFTVRQFRCGEIYEIRDGLARSFFAAGFAIRHSNDLQKQKKNKFHKKLYRKTNKQRKNNDLVQVVVKKKKRLKDNLES
ncbi:hypothetical protein N9W34_06950 [Rickettsiales bacterium]|nr:hypothetical protein [Rickettsiales bacterium]